MWKLIHDHDCDDVVIMQLQFTATKY